MLGLYAVQGGYMLFRCVIWMIGRVVYCSGGLYDVHGVMCCSGGLYAVQEDYIML